MGTLLDELERQSRLLTAKEKARLAHILIEGLDASQDRDVEQVWIAEAQRRYEACLRGEIEAHDGGEVMTRVRTGLNDW